MHCTKFGWNWLSGLEKMKMWKNYDNASNDDDDNDDVKRIKFDQKSSLEPSAKVSKKVLIHFNSFLN